MRDDVSRGIIEEALIEYMDTNWGSASNRATEWEAMKAMVSGRCIGLTCGVRRKIDRELLEG